MAERRVNWSPQRRLQTDDRETSNTTPELEGDAEQTSRLEMHRGVTQLLFNYPPGRFGALGCEVSQQIRASLFTAWDKVAPHETAFLQGSGRDQVTLLGCLRSCLKDRSIALEQMPEFRESCLYFRPGWIWPVAKHLALSFILFADELREF